MPMTSTTPSASWPWRIGALVALLAAMALAAAVLAHWGWRWFGPAPESVVPAPPPSRWADALATANPFGAATGVATGGGPATTGTGASPAVLAGDARLLGVMAGADGDGWALFRLGSQAALLARRGQEIAPEVILTAVRPDGVAIRDHGQSREVALRAPAVSTPPASGAGPSGSASGAPAGTRASAGAGLATCATPAGFAGPVLRVNAELLTGMGAQPDAWRALLTVAPGPTGAPAGLAVRDQSGFGAMLGLKDGDRITMANGIPLATPDDVLAAVVKPLTANLSVRVSGTREGKPAEWLLLNAGACPG
jgi:Type II secretion system protein C